jgi:hypothetical protein
MAKKKNKKGAAKAPNRRKFLQGGSAYALPTSMSATTNNLMGMGDPNLLSAQLASANLAQQELVKRQQQQQEQQQQEMASATQAGLDRKVEMATGEGAKNALKSGVQGIADYSNILKGTANAAQVANASGTSTANLLGNLGQYGTQAAQTAPGFGNAAANVAKGLGQGLKSMGPAAASAGLNIGGTLLERAANDDDATTMNFGEGAGKLMQGAGTGLGAAGVLTALGASGFGAPLAAIGAIGYGIHGLVQRNKARAAEDRMNEQNSIAQQNLSRAQQQAFSQNFTKSGTDMGFNTGNSLTNSYIPSQQQMYMAETGGLWDNIHAKRNRIKEGSGEKMRKPGSKGAPTDEALKRSQMKTGGQKVPGGMVKPMPGGAVEFVGNKHEQGGILLDPQTEVEGGETMDKVQMSKGDKSDYIFSDHLKLGKKTFAQRHKELVKRGASQKEIQRLARLQEAVANVSGEKERSPKAIQEYKDGGEKKSKNPWRFSPDEDWAYQARMDPNIDMEGFIGGKDYGDISNTAWGQYYSHFDNPEDWESFYNEDYTPRVKSYFENNPDEAYEYLQEMYNSDDPNAENFQRKLTDANGNMLPKEEALKVAQELATDTKVGSFHMALPQELQTLNPLGPKPIEQNVDRDIQLQTVERPETPETPEERKNIPPWAAALPGLFGLMGNSPMPSARSTSAQTSKAGVLPRVNFNAERAANQAQNTSTKRQLANKLSGPASAAAMLAADQNSRAQNLGIANQEARTNKEFMASEAGMQASTSAQNAAAVNQASMYNTSQLNQMNLENYQQGLINKRYNKGVVSGVARDAAQMYADDRYARLLDEFGAYKRANGETTNSNATEQEKAVAKAEAAGIDAAPISTPAVQQTTVSVPGQTIGAPGLLNTNTPIQGNPGFNPNVSTGIPLQPTGNNPIINFNSPTTVGTSAIMPGLRNGGYISRANKLRRQYRR